MPPLSRRQKAARTKVRSENGQIINASVVPVASESEQLLDAETPDVDDWELLGLSVELVARAASATPLVWTEDAEKGMRGIYTKDSRTTEWRKKNEMMKAGAISQKLTSFGFTVMSRTVVGSLSHTAASPNIEEDKDLGLQYLQSAVE